MAGPRLRWGILGVAKINDRLLPAFTRQKTPAAVRHGAGPAPVADAAS